MVSKVNKKYEQKILITIGLLIIAVILFGKYLQESKPTPAECGNGICEPEESGYNCPEDCCVSGDGRCLAGCTSEKDYDCEPVEVKAEIICTDGIDNDGDGLIDNEDGDCWIRQGPIYITHPYYYDGTFKALTEKIPEIADLGVKTIYLMPIWEHREGDPPHGFIYLIKDYYKIDPTYGTPEDLKKLVDTVHEYGMKIIFDLVTCCAPPGSVPWNNNWMIKIKLSELQEKAKELRWDLQYTTRGGYKFVYYNCKRKHHLQCTFRGRIIGDEVVVECYPTAQFGPAVDRSNPEIIEYFTKVAEYYVKEYDIDGWRLDAPNNHWNPEIIPGDHSSIELFRSVKDAITKIKPDAILFAEVPCCSPGDSALDEVCEVSYSHAFAKYFHFKILIEGSYKPKDLTKLLEKENIRYNRTRVYYFETQNGPRINKIAPQLNKPLLVLISTIPRVPMIQAGQEIGATNGYFGENPSVDWAHGDYKLREFYKKVFNIRNSNNALKYGSITNAWKSGDNTYAYLREYEDEKVIVVINFLDKTATSTLNLSFLPKGTVLYDELNDETFNVNEPGNFKISIPKYGSRILTLKTNR